MNGIVFAIGWTREQTDIRRAYVKKALGLSIARVHTFFTILLAKLEAVEEKRVALFFHPAINRIH